MDSALLYRELLQICCSTTCRPWRVDSEPALTKDSMLEIEVCIPNSQVEGWSTEYFSADSSQNGPDNER